VAKEDSPKNKSERTLKFVRLNLIDEIVPVQSQNPNSVTIDFKGHTLILRRTEITALSVEEEQTHQATLNRKRY
jgi:hypothetical protein